MLAGLQAGAAGVPFMPVRGLLGTDYLRVRPDFRVIADPYHPDEDVVVVPALRPDVAVFHAFQADTEGNVVASRVQNNRLLAQAARTVIATVEEVVEPSALRRDRGMVIPAIYLTAVVKAPFGAHPTRCPGFYPVDAVHMRRYTEAAKTDEGFAAYLETYVLGPGDHQEYLAMVRRDAVDEAEGAGAAASAAGQGR